MIDGGEISTETTTSSEINHQPVANPNKVSQWFFQLTPQIRLNILAIFVGIIGGLGAWIFRLAIHYVYVVLFLLPKAFLETHGLEKANWLPFLVSPILAGFFVGYLVYNVAEETKGHGVPEVIEAVSLHDGKMKLRVPFVKIVASAVTLGSGGSAGREGPIAQIGAGFGSLLGQKLNLSPKEMRTLVISGVGAGISATFNAPIGGTLFAIEIIVKEGAVTQFVPILIASVVGTVVGQFLLGSNPAFQNVPQLHYSHPQLIPLFVLLGLLTGVLSTGWIRVFYWFEDWFENATEKANIPKIFYVPLGGFFVGIMHLGIFLYAEDEWEKYTMMGRSYAPMEAVFQQEFYKTAFQSLIVLLLLLFLLKIAATMFTIGTGGSGGVFAPTLFLGVMFGALFGVIFQKTFGFGEERIVVFAILGMAAFFAGTGKAPLTAIMMTVEMTNDYFLIIPLMLAVTSSWLVATHIEKDDIYIKKLLRRGIRIGESGRIDILETIKVSEAMTPSDQLVTVDVKTRLEEVLELIRSTRHEGFPVMNQGRLVGVITLSDAEKALREEPKEWIVGEVLKNKARPIICTSKDASLAQAINIMVKRNISRLPIVEYCGSAPKLVGWLTHHDITSTYMKHQLLRTLSEESEEELLIIEEEEMEGADSEKHES